MSMPNAQRQMPAQAGRAAKGQGEALALAFSDEAWGPRHPSGDTGSALLQAALTTENLRRALKRVRANKGAAGVDGLDINQTSRHLATAWPSIREQLLTGAYRPSPVRRVTIPKSDGGERELGIPTVTDRLIQQALLRHRLRAIQLKHWKHGPTMHRELLKLGAAPLAAKQVANNARCWWRNSDRLLKTVLTIAYFDRLAACRTWGVEAKK